METVCHESKNAASISDRVIEMEGKKLRYLSL